jgi:hypothetical protein
MAVGGSLFFQVFEFGVLVKRDEAKSLNYFTFEGGMGVGPEVKVLNTFLASRYF